MTKMCKICVCVLPDKLELVSEQPDDPSPPSPRQAEPPEKCQCKVGEEFWHCGIIHPRT